MFNSKYIFFLNFVYLYLIFIQSSRGLYHPFLLNEQQLLRKKYKAPKRLMSHHPHVDPIKVLIKMYIYWQLLMCLKNNPTQKLSLT